jgi:hypothetical protein
MVTLAALLRLRAADSPPGPAPTMTTRSSSSDWEDCSVQPVAPMTPGSPVALHMPMLTTSLMIAICGHMQWQRSVNHILKGQVAVVLHCCL